MTKPLIAITGAGSGIGEATAQLFSEAGYPLLLLDKSLERIEALNLPHSLAMRVDVTNVKAMKNAMQQAEAQFGEIDCLVNNAGVMLLAKVVEQNPDEWQQMFNINLQGVMHGYHCVLPGMIARKHGTIIDISSVSGIKSFPASAAYCASKFGVQGMSEALRQEVAANNIRVIRIVPGAVETDILNQGSFSEITDGIKKWKESIGGALHPRSVAQAILYAYQQPQSVCVREIVLAPTLQEP